MKNPDWNREEIILALDLYFNLDYGQMHGRNHQVMQLSEELRRMSIHKNIPDPKSFRSVNSVALKLNNLKKLDQNFGGKGMRDGGKLEGEIWAEFYRHRDKLKKEADMVRLLYADFKQTDEAKESLTSSTITHLFYQVHKHRESDPMIKPKKIDSIIKNGGLLQCEICRFDPGTFYGELGRDILEIHYSGMLDALSIAETFTLDDFILVCPNCHSLIDKHYHLISPDDLKVIIMNK